VKTVFIGDMSSIFCASENFGNTGSTITHTNFKKTKISFGR
jgi:hypothetical protein